MTTLHHIKMDERLFTAALSGDSSPLFELLREDPLILHTVSLVTSNTLLHIASLLGHTEFARVTMQRNPRLSRVLNQQGLSPIHIASLTGDVEIVRELLNTDTELFALKDKDGRTPLHCALIKGSLEVLSELLSRHPESDRELTPSNETVLHLAVKNNQCHTFASLLLILRRFELADELLNRRDEEGNTVLHLATARKQYQTLKILLRDKKVDVNAVNSNGLTALDLLVTCPFESDDMVISEMLQRAGGERASTSPRPRRRPPSPQPPQLAVPSHESPAGEEGTSRSRHSDISNSERVVDSVKNGIIALAALFATVTFEVALNPPGGVWQGWDAIDDAKVIEAAMKANITNLAFLETVRSFSKIWPLSKLLGGPINKLNLTEPGLRGPAKAMSVTLWRRLHQILIF